MTKKQILLHRVAVALTAALLCVLAVLLAEVARAPEPTEPAATLPPNRYAPGDFYYRGDFLACSAGETVTGIDVSYHQGEIDWHQVKDAGVEFVMIRLGNRGTVSGSLGTDIRAKENLAGARAAGLKVGAYFYSQAVTMAEAKEEAALALEILDGFPLDLPLAYDWEREQRTQQVDRRTLTDCTLAFCGAVEAAGYRPMVYFNSYQAMELLYLEELTGCPWWLAMYDLTTEFPYRMDMWQYTCTGTVPGIAGSVDVNLLFPDGLVDAFRPD